MSVEVALTSRFIKLANVMIYFIRQTFGVIFYNLLWLIVL
jgi:hypothetical protein